MLIFIVFINNTLCCTIFMASKNGITLAGNNEDWVDPQTNVWFIPADKGMHGRVYFGFDVGLPQGGMNDQGLFFDCAATIPHMFTHPEQREEYKGNLMEKMLEECATVEEALKLFERYNLQHMFRFQILIADKSGDAAIIEGDRVIRKEGDYQIATNFRQSLNEEQPYSIERYSTAESMLAKCNEVTVKLFRSILDATHQEPVQDSGSPTQYSNICNLNTGDIYLYHFHDYSNVVKFNLQKELDRGEHSREISSLFPRTTAYNNYKKKNQSKERFPVAVEPSIFDRLIGEYEVIPQIHFTITKENGKLFGRMRGFSRYELIPESESTYFFKELKARFTFIQNDNCFVDSLIFEMYGQEMLARKIR